MVMERNSGLWKKEVISIDRVFCDRLSVDREGIREDGGSGLRGWTNPERFVGIFTTLHIIVIRNN